jgi:dipeptidyl aminopeptidase/acylaminoacyl peptidase
LLDLARGEPITQPRFFSGHDLTSGRILRNNRTYRILGIEFHHSKPANFFFDGNLQKIEKRLETAFPEKMIRYLGIDEEIGAFYFSVESDVYPGKLYRLLLRDNSLQAVISKFPGSGELDLRPMQPVEIPVPEEDRTIPAYLTTPEAEGPWPAILWVHGGPHTRDTWGFDPYVQYWAARGYAVLQVNYRGSTGYGARHGPFPIGRSARYAVEDILVAAEWLQKEGHAVPEKTAVIGNSFGAYVAVEAIMREEPPFRAAVGISGLYDLEGLRRQDERRHRHWSDDLFADYNEKTYEELSPVHHAERAAAPVMILHGKADRRVGISQAKTMVKQLKKAGKAVEYEYFTWGVHAFPDEEDRSEFFAKIHQFLRQSMRGAR